MKPARAVVVRELLLTVRRRGHRCRATAANVRPRERAFMRAVAALVAAWFDRETRV
jgi:hypothetical protein